MPIEKRRANCRIASGRPAAWRTAAARPQVGGDPPIQTRLQSVAKDKRLTK